MWHALLLSCVDGARERKIVQARSSHPSKVSRLCVDGGTKPAY